MAAPRDRLREFVDLIIAGLDEDLDGSSIAARALVSRYHFDRLVAAALGEPPGVFRRRLLIERAAWRLASSPASVTDVAIEAGCRSVEGFDRAFVRAFGAPPSRSRSAKGFRLPAPNGIHFHPPGGVFVPAERKGAPMMDVLDRLLEHDLWSARRILERAASLRPAALDRRVWERWDRMPFDADEPTVRSMLARMVWTYENWTASVAGREAPRSGGSSIDALGLRLERSGPEFVALVRDLRDRGEWDAGFVDALCDPPESFTFGGMVAHVLTFSAYRRQMLIKALAALGVDDVGLGDPVEWERSLA